MRPINFYKDQLKINPHLLDDTLMEQSQMFYEIGESLEEAVEQRDLAKKRVEEVEAEIIDEIISDSGTKKPSNDSLKRMAVQDPRYKSAYGNYLEQKREAGQWQALKEAFQQRSYSINRLVELYIAQYWTTDSVNKGSSSRKHADAEASKASMASKRKSLSRRKRST